MSSATPAARHCPATTVVGQDCPMRSTPTLTTTPTATSSSRGTTESIGISLVGLQKSFGDVHAVRGVDIEIAPGETVALLGPNGAGKSTTIDMMLGLLPPDSGHVTLFGRPAREAVAAGTVGAMLQSGGLIAFLTVRELVTMMASL